MKTYPEFYIKGDMGWFRFTTQAGYGNVSTMDWRAKPKVFKKRETAEKWLKSALIDDPTARIIDNTVTV